jgi:hypothetical protein
VFGEELRHLRTLTRAGLSSDDRDLIVIDGGQDLVLT